MNNRLNIILVDDHKMVRDGIKSILLVEEKIMIAGEAGSGKEALDLLKDNPLIDIAIVDINMEGMDGIELTGVISRNYQNVKICALTMVSEKDHIQQMIKNGAKGYLLKTTGKEELLEAIDQISRGKEYFSPEIKSILNSGKNEPISGNLMFQQFQFSEREELILQQIAVSGEIDLKSLFLTDKTLEIYLKNIFRKTNTQNLSQLKTYIDSNFRNEVINKQ